MKEVGKRILLKITIVFSISIMIETLCVIFHIDEEEKWNLLCSNAKNVLEKAREDKISIKIEILANSFAVKNLLKKENLDLEKKLFFLKEKNVSIYACENTIKNLNINKTMLLPIVETVPSGVYFIITEQVKGFKYVKP